MYLTIVIVFLSGYLLIALEHSIKINKAAIALLTGTICWVLFVFGAETLLPGIAPENVNHYLTENLRNHLGDIAEILFFLLGAMTIVEIIDAHQGFSVIIDRIKTTHRIKLLWLLCLLTFFLSTLLDNLTTSIIMAALLKKLIEDKKDLWMFAGMVIIAANAGGAWSPIGDVTTIMLWIGGQITATNIVTELIIPSLVCLLVPLIILSFKFKGNIEPPQINSSSVSNGFRISQFEKTVVFSIGIGSLIFVPIFKSLTGLPPFMGILFGLSLMWIVTELIHKNKVFEHKKALSIAGVLEKIDTPTILFFLGILIAVASLQSAGHLIDLAEFLDTSFDNIYAINTSIGILSSLVDNVPLVAAAMGMYSLETFPSDHTFWELLAFCAGTGGSILIIGSAAGVAMMGILKIDFVWYLRHISFLALTGYGSGILVYMLLN